MMMRFLRFFFFETIFRIIIIVLVQHSEVSYFFVMSRSYKLALSARPLIMTIIFPKEKKSLFNIFFNNYFCDQIETAVTKERKANKRICNHQGLYMDFVVHTSKLSQQQFVEKRP